MAGMTGMSPVGVALLQLHLDLVVAACVLHDSGYFLS